MISKEEMYLKLGFDKMEIEILQDIETNLLELKGEYRFYYKTSNTDIPPSIMNRVISQLKELGYRTIVGIEVNKGKYLEIKM